MGVDCVEHEVGVAQVGGRDRDGEVQRALALIYRRRVGHVQRAAWDVEKRSGLQDAIELRRTKHVRRERSLALRLASLLVPLQVRAEERGLDLYFLTFLDEVVLIMQP